MTREQYSRYEFVVIEDSTDRSWFYELYINNKSSINLVKSSKERFETSQEARFAAIGHINLLENKDDGELMTDHKKMLINKSGVYANLIWNIYGSITFILVNDDSNSTKIRQLSRLKSLLTMDMAHLFHVNSDQD